MKSNAMTTEQKQALEATTNQMLGALAKTAQVGVSVGHFVAAVREKFPAVEAELAKLLEAEDEKMKTVELQNDGGATR